MTRADTERVLREVGACQHGVVSRQQLIEHGIAAHAFDRMVSIGRIVVLHRGGYQIGPLPTGRTPETAALLACGAGSRISHWSAAMMQALHGTSIRHRPVEVTIPRRTRRRTEGIRLHRVRFELEHGTGPAR